MEEQREQPEWAAPPEDEYDALNDETFGDDGGEYTWGESTSLFDELQKDTTESIGGAGSNGYTANALVVTDAIAKSNVENRTKETDYYDYENDNALEESISRLVLDDMEDSDDEEEARKVKLSRLGASSNFSTYFMPPQVATKHLHWLMDKELPGGSSLLGSSVWSMHPTTTPEDVTIHQPSTPQRTVQPTVPINTLMKQPNNLSHDESIDAENNVSKFFGGVPSSTPLNSAAKKPVFKTVEEIERELLEGESRTTPTPKILDEVNVNHSKPKIMMAEDLERELIQESPMPSQRHPDFENTGRSPLQNISHFNQLFSPEPSSHLQNQQTPQKQSHQHHPLGSINTSNMGPSPNINFSNVPGGPPVLNANASVNNMILMEQQKQMLLARQGLIPAPPRPVLHPGMIPGGPLPPQLPQGFHPALSPMQHQQQIRMLQLHPHLRGRMPLIMPLPHGLPHMRPPGPSQIGFPPHAQIPAGFGKHIKTDDPYRGLMNEKDKQRLRNIQIIQLQNDHPFTTDYYNLMHKAKQAPPGGLQTVLLSKLYPKRDDGISKKKYQPAMFENCLGKLQAVSALAPKRVIDTFIRVTESKTAPRGGLKAYRYLLLEIEQLYDSLLTMEESDIRTSILCNADDKDQLRRSQNAKRMTKILINSEKLFLILAVPKGKMLICRALPLIDPAWTYKIIGRLLDVFPLWGSEEMDKAFPYLRHCILRAEIRELLTMIAGVTDNQIYESMVISRLGISVLTCIFHRAEHLLLNCDQMLLDDVESHWTRKTVFVISAILVKNEELAKPIEFYPNVLQHIRRFALHSTDTQMAESILQRWANAGIPAYVTHNPS